MTYDVSLAPTTAPDAPPNARYTNADEFLSLASKVVTEEVFIPAINRTVIVRALTALDVQRARTDTTEMKSGNRVPRQDRDFNTMIAFYATVKPDGSPFFRRNQIESLHTEANYAVIQPITKAAIRLSGLDDEAEEMARKKAFETTRDAD